MALQEIQPNKIFFFANPHLHHSYFTIAALSRLGSVIFLCPPLQLQLFAHQWSSETLNIYPPTFQISFCKIASVVFYVLFKLNLLTEQQYVGLISRMSDLLALNLKSFVFVHYQDYVKLSSRPRKSHAKDICELIINSSINQANWISTNCAVANADAIVVPSESITTSIEIVGKPCIIAPYGGNKNAYRKNSHDVFGHLKHESTIVTDAFTIVARANSFRKGIDIFVNALDGCSDNLPQLRYSAINVLICGAVQETGAIHVLRDLQRKLRSSNSIISISACQYSQSQYSLVLSNADLFVMPSRLEGSSPAALEALWHGVPSILSNHCGLENFKHGRHGILLDSNVSCELEKAILLALKSTSLRLMWKSYLAQDRELFSWEEYFTAYSALYDDLFS
jgi:glycosyltransferase involved in cell wall biosynthesis